MSEEEREARRLWYAMLQGLLAASLRATLDGETGRAVDLETAAERMKVAGASIDWKSEDAFREVYGR